MLDKFNRWRWALERRVIDDWRSAYKFSSVWIMSASGVILAAWTADPDLIREIIPARWLHLTLAVVVLSGIIARITKKPEPATPPAVVADQGRFDLPPTNGVIQ